MQLDIKTLLVMNFIMCSVSVLGIATIWFQNRERYDGMSLWLWSISLQLTGLALILNGRTAPGFFPLVLAGVVMTGGAILLLIGLERFLECRGSWAKHAWVLAACATALSYFTLVEPDMKARGVVMSVTALIVDAQIVWLLLGRVGHELRGATRVAGIVMCGYLLAGLGRLGLIMLDLPASHDIYRTSAVDAFATMTHTVLNVCLTLSLVLMVNRRLLQDVRSQEQTFSKTFHIAPYGLMLTQAADGRILEVNESFARMLGRSPAEMLGQSTLDLQLFESREERVRTLKGLSDSSAIAGAEIRFKTKSGEPRTGLFYADTIRIGGRDCILSSLGDITELSNIKTKLEIMATHDALTGLANRMLLYDRFAQALARARRHGSMLAIMSLDLDAFKAVNDELGHHAGDAVLVAVAKRLTGTLRAEDTASRFGGDEFVLLLEDIASPQDAEKAAAKILRALREPVTVDGRATPVSASVGVALFPGDGEDIETLLRKSDEALYRVKARGRDGHALFAETGPRPAGEDVRR